MSSVPISMRVTPSAAERLREAAARLGMGHSEYARLVLESALVGSNDGVAPSAHIEAQVEAQALWAMLRALRFSAGVHEWILRRAKREQLVSDGWSRADQDVEALTGEAAASDVGQGELEQQRAVARTPEPPRVPLAARLDEAAVAVLRMHAEKERMAPSTYAARVLEGATSMSGADAQAPVSPVVAELLRLAFFVSRGMEQLAGRELDVRGLWDEAEAYVSELIGWRPDKPKA